MEAHNLFKGNRPEGPGILFLEILGRHKGKPLQIIETLDVLRFYPRLIETPAVKIGPVIGVRDGPFQTFKLNRLQPLFCLGVRHKCLFHNTLLEFLSRSGKKAVNIACPRLIFLFPVFFFIRLRTNITPCFSPATTSINRIA